jgi:hypothetical protein
MPVRTKEGAQPAHGIGKGGKQVAMIMNQAKKIRGAQGMKRLAVKNTTVKKTKSVLTAGKKKRKTNAFVSHGSKVSKLSKKSVDFMFQQASFKRMTKGWMDEVAIDHWSKSDFPNMSMANKAFLCFQDALQTTAHNDLAHATESLAYKGQKSLGARDLAHSVNCQRKYQNTIKSEYK